MYTFKYRVLDFREGAMRKSIALSICAALGCALFSRIGLGQSSCAGMPIHPNWNIDGVLLYRMGTGSWQVLQPTAQLPRRGSVQFVYVVKEMWDTGRGGVVVIKTGSSSSTVQGSPVHQGAVWLVRSEHAAPTNGTCGRIKKFLPRYVAATSYDQYHNFGRRIPEADSDSLKAYHIHYLGHGDTCRGTNGTNWDSPLRGDFRSNRSQFSFDTYTVANGMTQFESSLGIGSALAGAAGLSNARVAMRRYHTDENKIACIAFNLNVLDPGYFLRINDLDASQTPGIFFRAYEKTWQLTP
jgi:hypothetical protein